MTDDLKDLKALMVKATPRPDAACRASHLALAVQNFEALHGVRTPTGGEQRGIQAMIQRAYNAVTTRTGVTATTALVCCGVLLMTPQASDVLRAPTNSEVSVSEFDSMPRVEDAPLMAEELSDDMVLQEPLVTPDGSVLQEPFVIPKADVPVEELFRERLLPEITPRSPTPMNSQELAQPETNMLAPSATAEIDDFDAEAFADNDAALGMTASPSQQPLRFAEGVASSIASDSEIFAHDTPNGLKITAEDPVSTFSIDVDTASYAIVRASLLRGELPPQEAVRIEEMVNYFPYDYPQPGIGEGPFRSTVTTLQTPWNTNTQLLHIALQGRMPAVHEHPPLNLVFLIDTSGSMEDPAKLPLLKQSFRLLLDQLGPEDDIAIVTYAGSAGLALPRTPASERERILEAINALGAGGSTNGAGGLGSAYAVATGMQRNDEVTRVILATDGDFNVGVNKPDALTDYIAAQRETGIYLSVLGFGRGTLNDATMQALAQSGNGTATYIDTLAEAQKVLVDQVTGALFPIASDVKVQIEFNPARVAEYRLIGYETRRLNRADFNNDFVDAGELGAGHTVTALYEITPVGSPAQLSDPLRYAPQTTVLRTDKIGFLRMRYKEPGAAESQLLETPILETTPPNSEAQFAAAVAGFGQLLRGDASVGSWSYADAIALANAHRGTDRFGYRSEAVQLMRLAESLSR